jgi:hypothetical protein
LQLVLSAFLLIVVKESVCVLRDLGALGGAFCFVIGFHF